MLGALEVIPFLEERDTVMGLLLSEPGPVRVDIVLPLSLRCGYRFTASDLSCLRAAKRADIADLILASTADVELLEEVSASPVTVSAARAICRNPHVPYRVIAGFHRDSRKGVTQAAVMAVAHRLSVPGKYAGALVGRILGLLSCPDDELIQQLDLVLAKTGGVDGEVAIAVAYERETPLPDDVWERVLEFVNFSRPRHGRFVRAVARDPRASLQVLLSLQHRCHSVHSRTLVMEAILDRRAELSREEALAALVQYSQQTQEIPHRYLELVTDADIPMLLAEEEDFASATVAFASGRVPESTMSELVNSFLGDSQNPALASALLLARMSGGRLTRSGFAAWQFTHPELAHVDAALAAGRPMADLSRALARNPRLTKEMQMKLLGPPESMFVSGTVDSLMANPGVHPDVAEVVVDTIVGAHESRQFPLWSVTRCASEMFRNSNIPRSITGRLPASLLNGYLYAQRLEEVTYFLRGELGADPRMWREFFALLPEWEGSIGDLAGVLRAL